MEKTKEVLHTQGEWKAVEMMKPTDSRYRGIYIQTKTKFIAELQPYGNDYEETKANAELICKAVNERQRLIDSNRELLEALTDCIERMEKCRGILQDGPSKGFWGILDITEAKTAIHNAKNLVP